MRKFLEWMIRYEKDQELRAAAVEALAVVSYLQPPEKIRNFFHLGRKLENGGFDSPIERE